MAKLKKEPEKVIDVTNEVISFETFQKFGTYEVNNMIRNAPVCFNGIVRIKKSKITIEPIEESDEVYAERVQQLWDECDTHHHHRILENLAQRYGVELQGSAGSKRKK